MHAPSHRVPHHIALSETIFAPREAVLKHGPSICWGVKPIEEGSMRRLVFGTLLLAIASVGSYALITASLAAARDAKAATFSERFAAVYK